MTARASHISSPVFRTVIINAQAVGRVPDLWGNEAHTCHSPTREASPRLMRERHQLAGPREPSGTKRNKRNNRRAPIANIWAPKLFLGARF
jgi:hypothetical protein